MAAQEQRARLRKSRLVRAENDRIAERARRLEFVRIPMLCECDDPGCSDVFPLSREEYLRARGHSAHFMTRPGHRLADAHPVTKDQRYWVQRINPDGQR